MVNLFVAFKTTDLQLPDHEHSPLHGGKAFRFHASDSFDLFCLNVSPLLGAPIGPCLPLTLVKSYRMVAKTVNITRWPGHVLVSTPSSMLPAVKNDSDKTSYGWKSIGIA